MEEFKARPLAISLLGCAGFYLSSEGARQKGGTIMTKIRYVLTVFAVCAGLLWAGIVGAQSGPPANAGPPSNPGPGAGVLAQCQDNLTTCNTDLGTCNADLATCDASAFVPQTGQTRCWDMSGNPLGSCADTGHDGEFQRGIVLPNPRFIDNLDGTVTDNLTGLIWLQDAFCGFAVKHWSAALSFANNLASGQCGLTDGSVAGDWRLPNVKELHSLINYEFVSPALSDAAGTAKWTTNGDAFTNVVLSNYWSSTTFTGNLSTAWTVQVQIGEVRFRSKGDPLFVLTVRGP